MEVKPEFCPHTVVAPHSTKCPEVLYMNHGFFGSRSRENTCSLKKKKSDAFKKTHETNLLMTPLKHSFKKRGGEKVSPVVVMFMVALWRN